MCPCDLQYWHAKNPGLRMAFPMPGCHMLINMILSYELKNQSITNGCKNVRISPQFRADRQHSLLLRRAGSAAPLFKANTEKPSSTSAVSTNWVWSVGGQVRVSSKVPKDGIQKCRDETPGGWGAWGVRVFGQRTISTDDRCWMVQILGNM